MIVGRTWIGAGLVAGLLAGCTSAHSPALSHSLPAAPRPLAGEVRPTPVAGPSSPGAQASLPVATTSAGLVSTPALRIAAPTGSPVATRVADTRLTPRRAAGATIQGNVMFGGRHVYAVTAAPDSPQYGPPLSWVSAVGPNGVLGRHAEVEGTLFGPAVGAGSLWFVRGVGARPQEFPGNGDLVRIDETTLAVTGSTQVGRPQALTYGAGSVWVARSKRLLRIDPRTLTVTASRVFSSALEAVDVGAGRVWMVEDGLGNDLHGRLIALDPTTMHETLVVTMPSISQSLAVSAHRLFALLAGDPITVAAYDTRTGQQLWTHAVTPNTGSALVAGTHDSVWYLTYPGHLGHLLANGVPAGAEVDLTALKQADRFVVQDGRILVAYPRGVVTLTPLR